MAVLGAFSLVLLISLVLLRVRILARSGIRAVHFGKTDRSDFLIPPFALVYFYAVFAGAFGWPSFERDLLFQPGIVQWIGLTFCVSGLALMALSLLSFGTSFRVGIDTEHPDALITTGVFGVTRNPIYVAFALVLLGEFLIQPYPLLLLYLVAGVGLFHRQVLREEAFLEQHYGKEYAEYRLRVPRYL